MLVYAALREASYGVGDTRMTTPPLAWLLGVHAGLGAVGGWLGLAIEIVVEAALFWHRVQRGGWRPARHGPGGRSTAAACQEAHGAPRVRH